MKDLLVEDVAPIYEKNYWGRLKCDDIPSGFDLCVFDFGVNAGTGRSAKYLQRMIGTVADGDIDNTLRTLGEYIDEHGLEVRNYQRTSKRHDNHTMKNSQPLRHSVEDGQEG